MRKLTIEISALAFVGLVGCTTDQNTRPSIDELNEGLNLIDVSDAAWGSTAAFVKEGHVVYLEQRVGAIKPQMYRDDSPDDPINEIDLRFVDENGRTFFIQRGGDAYVDATWGPELQQTINEPAPAEQRNRDFALAQIAATEFAAAAPAAFKDLRFTAANFATQLPPAQDPEMIKKAAEAELTRPNDTGYQDWQGWGWYYLSADLWDKGTQCVWGWCPARHSAVAMYFYDGYSWQAGVWACNHGNCPGGDKMGYRCSSNSGVWVENPNMTGENGGGGCLTSYNWNSGGYDHLCNDDSAYELWQIKNGNRGYGWSYDTHGDGYSFIYTGAGTGGDGGWVNYACTCAYNNGCNNDWSRPICP